MLTCLPCTHAVPTPLEVTKLSESSIYVRSSLLIAHMEERGVGSGDGRDGEGGIDEFWAAQTGPEQLRSLAPNSAQDEFPG